MHGPPGQFLHQYTQPIRGGGGLPEGGMEGLARVAVHAAPHARGVLHMTFLALQCAAAFLHLFGGDSGGRCGQRPAMHHLQCHMNAEIVSFLDTMLKHALCMWCAFYRCYVYSAQCQQGHAASTTSWTGGQRDVWIPHLDSTDPT